MTIDDFEIREDGRPVKIVTFVPVVGARQETADVGSRSDTSKAPRDGRFIVILLDDLFIGPLRTPKIREIAKKFIERLDGTDEIGVVRLNGDKSVTTTNREHALAALRQYTHERPPTPAGRGEWRARVDGAMDTVADVARQLAGVPHRRKSLVFVGAPAPFFPTVPGFPPTYSASWFGALRALAAANVALYYIDPRGLVHEGPDISTTGPAHGFGMSAGVQDVDHAIAFANNSGGEAFVNSNLFDRAVEQIWRETTHYYLLGYEPPVTDDNQHKISVHVRRSGVAVRARKSR